MGWGFLSFLAEPWFIIPWYAIGIAGFAYVVYDLHAINTPLKQAMKWAWPIIILFFSVIGLALYFGTARAPGIGRIEDPQEKKKAHDQYEMNMARRVNGAVIHCVAGDGLGIMTAMVIARALSATFWQEFWFEYAVGFLFGWFIFQFRSMTMMTESKLMALAMAFRAEFFSMLTVMSGMGAVMTYVTPAVVGTQPKPLTLAFWGFGMLGLLVGYVLTFPMNWMMVKIGWKHGMGGKGGSHQVESSGARYSLVTTMVVLGAAALVLPAWLTELREGRAIGGAGAMTASPGGPRVAILEQGLFQSVQEAEQKLREGHRKEATHSIDAAMRAAEVGAKAVGGRFHDVLSEIKQVRRALQMGNARAAKTKLALAGEQLIAMGPLNVQPPPDPHRYKEVPVINANGVMVGELTDVRRERIQLALGGARDVWGIWDLSARQILTVTPNDLLFGPKRLIGKSYVMLPELSTPSKETG